MDSTVLICGSRNWDDQSKVVAELEYLFTDENDEALSFVEKIISGGAKGPDSWAEQFAKDRGIPFKMYVADWGTHGKAAGPIRNLLMVKNADIVVAFWDGKSEGTLHTIEEAIKHRKELHLYFKET